MSVFSKISDVFHKLFGSDSGVAQVILSDVSLLILRAQPIVSDVETIVKAAPSSATTEAILKYVSKYESDAAKVQSVVSSFVGQSGPNLWRGLAVWALTLFVPATTTANNLNLAIEFALAIMKRKISAAATT